MSINSEIHPIQSAILTTLLFHPLSRFTDLNKLEAPSDQFNFHLKSLVSLGLIEKKDKGNYALTNTGKEFANRFDTDLKVIERQAKVGVLISCQRERMGEKQYLVQQRLKEPYYGFWGFISGKISWGESIFETAEKELMEEAGLSAEYKLVGIKHKTDNDYNNNILEDKFFFVINAFNTKGKLKSSFEGGKNKWFAKEEIFKLKNLFPDVDGTIAMTESKQMVFKELRVKVDKY